MILQYNRLKFILGSLSPFIIALAVVVTIVVDNPTVVVIIVEAVVHTTLFGFSNKIKII